MNPPEAAVADAGPIIHLDELSSLWLLNCYEKIWVPDRVAREAEAYRPGWQKRMPRNHEVVEVGKREVAALLDQLDESLDPGEIEALALWRLHPGATVLCDDLIARKTAMNFGATVIGTLGLIIKAARQERMSKESMLDLIQEIPDSTSLHVSKDLIEFCIREIEKTQR
ncbi:MAG: hypothetical protein JRJ87_26280 [Deltaproteobacteria bacterium]|nr:hypothetical protein [Deltaproteobacteria bacterium]